MKSPQILLLLCVLLTAGNTEAATSLDYTIRGVDHWPSGGAQHRDLKVMGDIGYTVGNIGVLVYNFTDPQNVVLIGGYKVQESAWKVELSGTDALYLIGNNWIWNFDRSDPHNLVLKGVTLHGRPNGQGFIDATVQVSQNALYLFEAGLVIRFSLADRFAPTFVGQFQHHISARTWVFREEKSYTATEVGWRYYWSDHEGLKTFHLPGTGNPLSMSQRINTQTDASLQDMDFLVIGGPHVGFTAKGTDLYLMKKAPINGPHGSVFYSFNWWTIGQSTYVDSNIKDMMVSGDDLYVMTQTKIIVYDISGATLSIRSEHTVGASAFFPTSKGIFIANLDWSSITRFDRPTHPVNANVLPTPAEFTPIAHITSDGTSVRFHGTGIEIYRPDLVSMTFFEYQQEIIAIGSSGGKRLYVANAAELLVIDISAVPVLVGKYLQADIRKIHVDGDLLYLACGAHGLVVLSFKGTVLKRVAQYSTVTPSESVIVSETKAYLVDGVSLHILDVCVPSSPVFLGNVTIAEGAFDVLVKGVTAYVAGTANLMVVDVLTPASPAVIVTQASVPFTMAMSGDALFVVAKASTGGVIIRDITVPRVPTIVGEHFISTANKIETNVYAAGNILLVTAKADTISSMWGFTISGQNPTLTSYDTGCFADNRAVKSRRVAFFTPLQCFTECSTAGHTHAGSLLASECWCGGVPELVKSVRTNAVDCLGSGHSNMEMTSTERFSHVGCFEDNVGRTAYVSAEMSVEHCAAYCASDTVRNYKYFGIQKGDTCWCTQDIRSNAPAADADCNAPCIGNGEAFCGGTFRSNMYALNSLAFTVGITTASETYAESSHSFPIEVEYWDGSVQIVGSVVAPAQGSIQGMTATGIQQHPRIIRIRAQGGDGWTVAKVTINMSGSEVTWLTDGVLGKVVKNTPGSEVVEWTAPPGSS